MVANSDPTCFFFKYSTHISNDCSESLRPYNPIYFLCDVFQTNGVIIDTVLLTDADGNDKQKAISHATGDHC